jgi:hypothetical protein
VVWWGSRSKTPLIGKFNRNEFAVVPEVDVNFGYQYQNVRLFVGYTFLYANNVLRPGPQIDHAINSTQSILFLNTPANLVGSPNPSVNMTSSTFWAQGINVGLQISF